MSVKFLYSSEKTNSFRPVPWHWSEKPFPAYRGDGARHRNFLAVAREYAPVFVGRAPSADGYACPTTGFDPTATKIIRTREKGTILLVTCVPEQDEQIMLITLRGGFRGGYSRIEVKGGEILAQESSNVHCCPTAHLIVRLTHPSGYVFAETGRRCSIGLVEIFCWTGYQIMSTQEFAAWQSSSSSSKTSPDLTEASKADAKARVRAERKAAEEGERVRTDREAQAKAAIDAASRAAKADGLGARIEALRLRWEAAALVGEEFPTLGESTFRWQWRDRYYCEPEVKSFESWIAQREHEKEERERKRVAREAFQPKFAALEARAAAITFEIVYGGEGARLETCTTCHPYSEEGLAAFTAELDRREREHAEARAKAHAEARYQERKTEAQAAGLPTDIRIWCRRGGATNAGDGWVIGPDGKDRANATWFNEDARRLARYGEGDKIWEQILVGEVVLKWGKEYTAAPHVFEVVHLPAEGLTEAQAERIREIEAELAAEWDGRSGMSGKTSSPSVGNGWGLSVTPAPKPDPTTHATIGDLMAKFNGPRDRR